MPKARSLHVLIGTLVLITAACDPRTEPDRPDQEVKYPPGLTFLCDEEPNVNPAEVNALTGGNTFEHEAHDCQRLVIDGGARYGPLVGIFPLDGAMVPGFGGGPVASLVNFQADGAVEHGYEPLNISADYTDSWSCVSIEPFGPADTVAVATIWRLSSGTCQQAEKEREDVGTPLRVRISEHPALSEMPETARIRWDPATSKHYIGLRCGVRWCTIHPADVRPSEPVRWDASTDPRQVVPGYFDEQHLAVDDGSGSLKPGPWARIEPSRELETVVESDLISPGGGAAQPVRLARITVFEDPSLFPTDYSKKFNLVEDNGRWTSEIWLHRGDGGPLSSRAVFASTVSRVDAVTTPEFIPMPHGAPGSVRWRWLDTDEGAWLYCINGCCSIQGNL